MDRELVAYFLEARRERAAVRAPTGAGRFMALIAEHLSDLPATVFSEVGDVLMQTSPAVTLFGDYTTGPSRNLVDRWLTDPEARARLLVEVGATGDHRRRRYRHPALGEVELYRQLLVDPVDLQVLLVFTAVPGSPTDQKLRSVGRLT